MFWRVSGASTNFAVSFCCFIAKKDVQQESHNSHKKFASCAPGWEPESEDEAQFLRPWWNRVRLVFFRKAGVFFMAWFSPNIFQKKTTAGGACRKIIKGKSFYPRTLVRQAWWSSYWSGLERGDDLKLNSSKDKAKGRFIMVYIHVPIPKKTTRRVICWFCEVFSLNHGDLCHHPPSKLTGFWMKNLVMPQEIRFWHQKRNMLFFFVSFPFLVAMKRQQQIKNQTNVEMGV